MRRVLLLVALVAGMVFLTPTAALACSCAERSTAADVKRAGSVFEGNLVWTSSNGVDASYGVEVAQVFKGRAAAFEKLRTKPHAAACALGDPVTDRRYLFFVQGEHPGQMQLEACGGSVPSSDAVLADVTAVTGAATEPLPARKPTAEAGSEGLGLLGWSVVVVGVGLLVLLGTSALKRSF